MTMPDTKKHLEELAHFIRAHRSKEGSFETLYEKLVEEAQWAQDNGLDQSYSDALHETLEKYAATYQQNKDNGNHSWAEFENFVSHFEVAVTEALSAV